MTVHGGITQRVVKPTTNSLPLYTLWKDEHDHEVREPESPKECGSCGLLKYTAGSMPQKQHGFYTLQTFQ